MSPNNQNYCGVSYFWIVTRTVNKRSLGQNDTAWLGQNDTVWNNLIWLCLTFCLPTGHFWATSSTPLSANGPLLGHLFGFDFWENVTAIYSVVVFNVKKNPFSARYFWSGLFSWNALRIRGDYMKVLSVKIKMPLLCFFPLSITWRHKSHETPIVTCDGAQWTRDVQKVLVSMK